MSELKNKFADFLSEIEQMEKDNEKLNKDINELEKEKAEEWKKFNTDTHMLVQIKELKEILDRLDDTRYDAENSADNVESVRSYADDASYSASEIGGSIRDIKNDLADLIAEDTKEEESK